MEFFTTFVRDYMLEILSQSGLVVGKFSFSLNGAGLFAVCSWSMRDANRVERIRKSVFVCVKF